MLRRDDEGRFDLGPELAALGRLADQRFPLVELARAVLTQLRDADRRERAALRPRRHAAAMRAVAPVTARPAVDRARRRAVATRPRIGRPGAVGRARPRGWVASVEEREAGVASVSAPVRVGDATVVAAVSISGPVERLSRRPGDRFGAQVVEAAARITVP